MLSKRMAAMAALAATAAGAASAQSETPAAPAGPAAIEWDAEGAARSMASVAPKDTQRHCTALKARERVVYAYVAQGPVDFRIEPAGSLQPLVFQDRQRETRDAFTPAREGRYCWAWINRGEVPVQLSIQWRRR